MNRIFILIILGIISNFVLSQSLLPIKVGDYYNFINCKGETTIKGKFENALYFSNELAAVKMKNKWGYIDTTSNFIVKPKFDSAYSFKFKRALVKSDNLYGFIDNNGDVVIDIIYKNAFSFSNYLTIVQKRNNKWIFIDTSGRKQYYLNRKIKNKVLKKGENPLNNKFSPVVLINYNEIYPSDFNCVKFISINRKVIKTNDTIISFKDSMGIYKSNGKFGLKNFEFESLTELKYNQVSEIYNNSVWLADSSTLYYHKLSNNILYSKKYNININPLLIQQEKGLCKIYYSNFDSVMIVNNNGDGLCLNLTSLEKAKLIDGSITHKITICSSNYIIKHSSSNASMYINIYGRVIWSSDNKYEKVGRVIFLK